MESKTAGVGFWGSLRVLITGANGFVGRSVVRALRERQCGHILTFSHREYDLRDRSAIRCLLEKTRPDMVLHLAAVVGGIGANRANPGRFFYENSIMGIELIEQARNFNIRKFVCIGTICAYPKFTHVPFREDDLWNGYPEETNAPYGLAKKMLLVQCQAYREQYGFQGIYLLPVNLYGPGDNFDLESSHVIPALIRKCTEARLRGEKKVTVWGTGAASREFLYVDDCAEGILLAAENYNKPEPVNLGTGEEITIRDLVALIKELTHFEGEIEWDVTKPDGQPRRCLSTERAEQEFGFRAKIKMREGLARTIQWYENECVKQVAAR